MGIKRWTIGMAIRATGHDETPDRHLYRLAVLVPSRRSQLDQSVIRARLRRTYFKDLALEVKFIARMHRQRPAKFVEADADDAPCRLELAFDPADGLLRPDVDSDTVIGVWC